MRKIISSVVVILATAFITDTAEPKSQSNEKEVLSKWMGSWKTDIVVKPAAWTPKGYKVSGTTETEWILRGQFQQISGNFGKQQIQEIQRFDHMSNRFHMILIHPYPP